VRMRKVPITGKAPLRRWQVQTHRLMSNRKPILRGACDGEPVLLRLGRFRQRPPRPATSFNGSLECIRSLRLRPHRPAAGAEQQDEFPVRTTNGKTYWQFAYDHSTISIL